MKGRFQMQTAMAERRRPALRLGRFPLARNHGTGPLPLPATHGSILSGGREGERAGAVRSENALDRRRW